MTDEDVEVESGPLEVDSDVAPPLINCPNCDGMLPLGLGMKTCALCGAVANIEHEPTRKEWANERFACPNCSKVLVCGVRERPAIVACSSCSGEIVVKSKVVKVEIACPSCERRLRLKPRPGSRQITCPACEDAFKVTF